jgi:hypothetical protein
MNDVIVGRYAGRVAVRGPKIPEYVTPEYRTYIRVAFGSPGCAEFVPAAVGLLSPTPVSEVDATEIGTYQPIRRVVNDAPVGPVEPVAPVAPCGPGVPVGPVGPTAP